MINRTFFLFSRKAEIVFENRQQKASNNIMRPKKNKDNNDQKRLSKELPAPLREIRALTKENKALFTGGSSIIMQIIIPARTITIANFFIFFELQT
jgi:hypothetical protein